MGSNISTFCRYFFVAITFLSVESMSVRKCIAAFDNEFYSDK